MPILTINSGSSSLKACLFHDGGTRRDFRYGHIRSPQEAFDQLMRDLHHEMPAMVGHRFVHGGEVAEPARVIDPAKRARLEALVHLAPLHMPGNLLGVDLCRERFPVPQVACFDTAFHATMPEEARRFPIPDELGLRRFGFHGLNYSHVARELPGLIGSAARGRVVVAHLGSGVSLCLLEGLRSVDTTMGYTPAGGVVMGTRSGDLDPGVMLELARRYDHEALADMVYHRMGLLALSDGLSSEMSDLMADGGAAANFAIAYFCRQIQAAIGALAAKAGGIDALVFTGGIGEHVPAVREAICDKLGFMGIALDAERNLVSAGRIEQAGGKPVLIVPADEEKMIRDLCRELR
jgi:acetate kinase